MNDGLLCLTCCVAAKLDGVTEGSEEHARIDQAVTMVPDWHSTIVAGQQLWACVPVPVCWEHLTVTKQTALDDGRLVTG